MKGKCYSQESRKGASNETYRVKQVKGRSTRIMGQGFPLMAHNTGRVPTLSEMGKSGVSGLDWESSQA